MEKSSQERAPITRINASELGFSAVEIDKMFLALQNNPLAAEYREFDYDKMALAILNHEGIQSRGDIEEGSIFRVSDDERWRVTIDEDDCKTDLSKKQTVLPVILQRVTLNQHEQWVNSGPAKELRVVLKPSGQALKRARREHEVLMKSEAEDKEQRKNLEVFIGKNLGRLFTRRDFEAMDESTRRVVGSALGNIDEYDVFEFVDAGERWQLFGYEKRRDGERIVKDIKEFDKLDQKNNHLARSEK